MSFIELAIPAHFTVIGLQVRICLY